MGMALIVDFIAVGLNFTLVCIYLLTGALCRRCFCGSFAAADFVESGSVYIVRNHTASKYSLSRFVIVLFWLTVSTNVA